MGNIAQSGISPRQSVICSLDEDYFNRVD